MPNLSTALNLAQSYTWDQSHGYTINGMGYPDFDCSGFVGRCLYEAGFNYPSYHVGTMDMDDNPMSSLNALGSAGFQLIHVTDLNNIPTMQHGDIVVMNSFDLSWQGVAGHTFFYCENIRAYTDPNADSDNIGIVSCAKVEASIDHDGLPGDSKKDGTGAYWEVWSHAYYTLIDASRYDPQNPNYNNFVTIARWPGGAFDDAAAILAGALLLYKRKGKNKKWLL